MWIFIIKIRQSHNHLIFIMGILLPEKAVFIHLANPTMHQKYPTMYHFGTEMCTHVHISITKWCIVGLWDWCIVGFVRLAYWNVAQEYNHKDDLCFSHLSSHSHKTFIALITSWDSVSTWKTIKYSEFLLRLYHEYLKKSGCTDPDVIPMAVKWPWSVRNKNSSMRWQDFPESKRLCLSVTRPIIPTPWHLTWMMLNNYRIKQNGGCFAADIFKCIILNKIITFLIEWH